MNSQIFDIFAKKELHTWDLWVNWQFTGFACFLLCVKKQQLCTWQRMICFLVKPDGELGYTNISLGKSWYQVASESLSARLTKVKWMKENWGLKTFVSFQCLWCSVSFPFSSTFLSVSSRVHVYCFACLLPPLVETRKRDIGLPSQMTRSGDSSRISQGSLKYSWVFQTQEI